jgi:hypothetical protein
VTHDLRFWRGRWHMSCARLGAGIIQLDSLKTRFLAGDNGTKLLGAVAD